MRSVQLGFVLLFVSITASAKNAFGQVASFCAVDISRTCLEAFGPRAVFDKGSCASLTCSGWLHECDGAPIPYWYSTTTAAVDAADWPTSTSLRTEPAPAGGIGNWTTSNILATSKTCATGFICKPLCAYDIDEGIYFCLTQSQQAIRFGTYPLGEICDAPPAEQ